jgi:hypothetical protein
VAGGERRHATEGGERMRDNGRAPIVASELPPNLLMIYPGARPVVACPDCGTWRIPSRRMLPTHRAADGVRRCPGSRTRVIIDLTPAQWQAALRIAVREAGLRRGSYVRRSARPPIAPPVFRIANAA